MLCDICHSREATIKFTQIVNLKKKEMNICSVCAEEKGFANPLVGLQNLFGSMLSLNQLEEIEDITGEEDEINLHCDVCGTTWQDFQKEGLLGCKDCYSVFNEKLKILLRRIHGSNKHIGNRPANHRIIMEETDLKKLTIELENAIQLEKFERAAILRDRIRDMEANINRMQK